METERFFGTDGIRGVANIHPITPEVALKLGRAIARVLNAQRPGQHKVVIGKDTRLSGYMLETALTSGLVSEGARVLLTGPVPTPAVAHLTRSMGCDAGIMLTASHNAYADNGLKIFGPDGYKLDDGLEREVERLLAGEVLAEPHVAGGIGKAVRIDDAVGRYIEFAKSAAGATRLHGLRVVIDCANGAGYFVGPLVLEELGAEVITRAAKPDGTNINDGCGALHPDTAAAVVLEQKADVGICLDGDADRVIFIDATGKVVSGDRILCLCARALHREGNLRHDTLVATIMSNAGMIEALEADGIQVVTTGVGDRQVIRSMREHDYSFGGENSGHLIFANHSTTGDGIMSALKVLSMIQETGKPLHELADCMREYPSRLIGIRVSRKPPLESIPEICAAIAAAEDEIQGLGRTLVRYSGTENLLRVLVEAREAELAERHARAIVQAAEQTIGSGV